MKVINVRKYILGFSFLAYTLLVHPSKAIGLATGPCVGISGFYTNFNGQPAQPVSMENLALQMGWFAKLDLWLLYAKVDGLLVLDWHKFPNQLDRHYLPSITMPCTIGVPVFSLLRPHIGLVFRIPLYDLHDAKFKDHELIKRYANHINGYILGLGIDLSCFLIDIYCEFGRSTVTRKSIDTTLVDGNKSYRPKQVVLRLHYNLLG